MSVEIRNVRLLGTTWASRGWRYWTRRFWLALFFALVAAFEITIAIGLWSDLFKSSLSNTVKLILSTVILVLVIGGFVWAFRTLWDIASAEYRNDIPRLRAIAERAKGQDRRKAGLAGLTLGVGGLSGIPAAGLALLVGAFAALGWALVMLVMNVMPYISAEEYLAVHDQKRSGA